MTKVEYRVLERIGTKWLVGNDGTIVRARDEKPLRVFRGQYLRVCLDGYFQSVHRLVAEAFVSGYRPFLEVHHIDNNRYNNHYTNLMWVTKDQNQSYAVHAIPKKIELCNPEGDIITYPSIGAICRDHGLTRKALENLFNHKIKSFKGWRLPENIEY